MKASRGLKTGLVALAILGVAVIWMEMGGEEGATEALVSMVIIIPLYFLPAFLAAHRDHHQANPIFLLNLFLGWTGIGWIAALIWSVSAVRRDLWPAQPKPPPRAAKAPEPPPQPKPSAPPSKPAAKKWFEER